MFVHVGIQGNTKLIHVTGGLAIELNCVLYSVQFASLAFHYKVILITIYIVMAIVEAVRLYLGYVGNLQEKVKIYLEMKILSIRID